jgi:leucyl/phenylalanyl-tRNA--protein transferase
VFSSVADDEVRRSLRLYDFPSPEEAGEEGLLAYGGDLSPGRLLSAYARGIFPWYSEGDPILWWSPDPRMVIYPGGLHLSRSFRRVLRNAKYSVVFDRDFRKVVESCASVDRRGEDGTWIDDDIVEAYTTLHHMGYAHSVEVYMDGSLAGGLYGLAIGGAFFGESMFSLRPNGSKIALYALSDVLSERGYDFVDCQIVTGHLLKMGGEVIERSLFLRRLGLSISKSGDRGSWSEYRWEYTDGR